MGKQRSKQRGATQAAKAAPAATAAPEAPTAEHEVPTAAAASTGRTPATSLASTRGATARATPASTAARATPAGMAARGSPAPAERPVFWFGYAIPWAKLVVLRVAMFGVLAIDAVLQISHAPRYGAGGFNVAQLRILDGLGPARTGYAIGELVLAYAFTLAALGVGTRLVVPVAAVIYGWLYLGSQLDSYQHHYLIVLLLIAASAVPWARPPGATPGTPVRSWALRLILVQMGIVYLWAAVSKMDAAWLDGRTIATQITGSLGGAVRATIGFPAIAKLTVVVELALAVAVWVRPAWWLALPLGLGFHAGIMASDLEIGLFAELMLALYLLVVPDRVFTALARTAPARALGHALAFVRCEGTGAAWIVTGVALGGGLLLTRASRLPYVGTTALVLTLVPVGLLAARRLGGRHVIATVALAHLLAIGVWVLVDRGTDTAVDYYRFWGGSSRRLGDPATAEGAYRAVTELAPTEPAGHYQLGRLLLARGEEAPGLAALHAAQRLEPARARAWVAEATYLQGQGRTADAITAARAAVTAEPTHAEARALLVRLTGTAPVRGPRPAADASSDSPDGPDGPDGPR